MQNIIFPSHKLSPVAHRASSLPDSGSESGSHKGGGGGGLRKGGGGGGGGTGSDGKPTRVRTVLNEKQLHTLRTCYAANPRPDALMKEQLVEMTGLSPRVIRVWFQNKRCKDKKKTILMKQQMQQEKVGVHRLMAFYDSGSFLSDFEIRSKSVNSFLINT